MIDRVLSEVKKPPSDEAASTTKYHKYFPPDFSQKQMDQVIVKLLKNWKAEQSA
jgi:hypothetical protein